MKNKHPYHNNKNKITTYCFYSEGLSNLYGYFQKSMPLYFKKYQISRYLSNMSLSFDISYN